MWIFKLYIFRGLISQENTLNFTKGIIKTVGRWMTLFELSFQLETIKGESIILSGLLHLRISVVIFIIFSIHCEWNEVTQTPHLPKSTLFWWLACSVLTECSEWWMCTPKTQVNSVSWWTEATDKVFCRKCLLPSGVWRMTNWSQSSKHRESLWSTFHKHSELQVCISGCQYSVWAAFPILQTIVRSHTIVMLESDKRFMTQIWKMCGNLSFSVCLFHCWLFTSLLH